MTWQILRSVVQELDVSEYIDMYTEKFPRFDEVWRGLEWLLARTPAVEGSVRRISGGVEYRAYVVAGDVLANTPDVQVVYRYTEDEVFVLGIFAEQSRGDEAFGGAGLA